MLTFQTIPSSPNLVFFPHPPRKLKQRMRMIERELSNECNGHWCFSIHPEGQSVHPAFANLQLNPPTPTPSLARLAVSISVNSMGRKMKGKRERRGPEPVGCGQLKVKAQKGIQRAFGHTKGERVEKCKEGREGKHFILAGKGATITKVRAGYLTPTQ